MRLTSRDGRRALALWPRRSRRFFEEASHLCAGVCWTADKLVKVLATRTSGGRTEDRWEDGAVRRTARTRAVAALAAVGSLPRSRLLEIVTLMSHVGRALSKARRSALIWRDMPFEDRGAAHDCALIVSGACEHLRSAVGCLGSSWRRHSALMACREVRRLRRQHRTVTPVVIAMTSPFVVASLGWSDTLRFLGQALDHLSHGALVIEAMLADEL